MTLFERETIQDKKLETAFALLEMNEYRMEGLKSVVPALKELFVTTLQRALGDKQHRIRGMAASHLGALQDLSVVPLLVKALEDDHAYVRSCAALGLGRLRATETRDRLKTVMEQDWDQTVRSEPRKHWNECGSDDYAACIRPIPQSTRSRQSQAGSSSEMGGRTNLVLG